MIIGAGGIGSHLISFLERIGIYDITVFDDDKVDYFNRELKITYIEYF